MSFLVCDKVKNTPLDLVIGEEESLFVREEPRTRHDGPAVETVPKPFFAVVQGQTTRPKLLHNNFSTSFFFRFRNENIESKRAP